MLKSRNAAAKPLKEWQPVFPRGPHPGGHGARNHVLAKMIDPAKKRPGAGLDQQQPVPARGSHDITQIRIFQKPAAGGIGQQGSAVPGTAIKNHDLGNNALNRALNQRRQGHGKCLFLIFAFNQNTDHEAFYCMHDGYAR